MKKLFFVFVAVLCVAANAHAGKGYTNDTAPATCVDGDFWIDTNGTSAERFHVCEEGTWVKHLGNGTTSNPSFLSVHASGGNLAAANKQVTKAWQTGLSYTADVTSVIHGGKHWIAKTTHTAGSTTEPGVGANYTDAWTEVSGSGDNLGSATYSNVVALWASGSCSGYLKNDGTCDTPSGSATYPSSTGLANWTGSAWGTSQSLGTGVGTWLATPSGANLASALTSALPATKGGTGLTALGTGVATALGNNVNGTGGFVTYDSLPPITWGTGLTDTSNTISVTYPVTAEAWSGSGWNADTDGLQRNDAYDYLHISDTDDDGLPDKVDVGDGIPKATSNVLSVATPGTDYTTPSSTETFTNKTLDVRDATNTLKGYGYITFTKPHNRGSATGAVGTTETSMLYGVPSFADDVETNNYVDYIGEVPRDLDTTVDMVAYFKFRLGGADTGDHSYKISMIDVADSGTAAGTPGDSITLAYTADASGADGDVETATGTLTDWKTNASAGSFWLIRVTRDGDDGTNDTSTVDSYPLELTIRYGFSQ